MTMNIDTYKQDPYKSFSDQRKRFELLTQKKEKRNNTLIAAASFVGATLPLALYNIKKGNCSQIKDTFQNVNSKTKDKAFSLLKLVDVDNIKQIGLSIGGAILASVGMGVALDKNKENRKEKAKEGIYGFLNCMIPMGIISTAEFVLRKNNIKTGVLGKVGMIAGGVGGGMFINNKVSNKINKEIFGKNDKDFKERKMKPTDCLVHFDDILGLFVISKIPYVESLGKILPLIYTHSGIEAGSKKKE